MLARAPQPLFGLSDDETRLLAAHMRDWQILRQCCGCQQSLASRNALHGLPTTGRPEDFGEGRSA